MKKLARISFIICTVLMILNLDYVNAAPNPYLSAQSAILIDANTGDILFEKNAFERRQPASTTKVLTSILALELGKMSDVVSISSKAANTREASIGLRLGEKVTLENLLHGALIRSGNDACVAIAEHLGDSVTQYVTLMNLKAHLLGATETNFVNTNGLPNENHLTTAYDLAAITRYALENESFKKIVGQRNYTLVWEESNRKLYIKNTNKLLWTYPGVLGVKTGTTDKAGKCLISAAKKGSQTLIAVVLKSSNRFTDSQKLLDYGFNNFQEMKVFLKNEELVVSDTSLPVKIGVNQDVTVTVPNGEIITTDYFYFSNIESGIAKGDFVGIAYIKAGDKIIKSVPIQALSQLRLNVSDDNESFVLEKIKYYFESEEKPWLETFIEKLF